MDPDPHLHPHPQRRMLLRAALGAVGAAAAPSLLRPALAASSVNSKRILVVLELSGGNDGLNTLVPFHDDAYYRLRPQIGVRENRLRKIDDRYGFSPGMAGFEALYKDGRMAVIHGCGYSQPSYSHFTSMAYWHTGAPNSGEPYGWMGRLADAIDPRLTPNFLVNVDETQSLAVRAQHHVPVVFDDPSQFVRKGLFETRTLLDGMGQGTASGNAAQRRLQELARSARDASNVVRQAWGNYRTPVDYGVVPLDLPKIAALVAADFPARLYYTAYRHNAFDTHVQQGEQHPRLLTYLSDSVAGFMRDLDRIGRADDVTLLVFSEFGRRAAENTNLGTDHGTANHMYLIGKQVRGGHYGTPPSLTALDDGGNMIHTTDFRRVYATVAQGWMGCADSAALFHGSFDPLPVFG